MVIFDTHFQIDISRGIYAKTFIPFTKLTVYYIKQTKVTYSVVLSSFPDEWYYSCNYFAVVSLKIRKTFKIVINLHVKVKSSMIVWFHLFLILESSTKGVHFTPHPTQFDDIQFAFWLARIRPLTNCTGVVTEFSTLRLSFQLSHTRNKYFQLIVEFSHSIFYDCGPESLQGPSSVRAIQRKAFL